MVEPIDPEFEADDSAGSGQASLPSLPDDDADFAAEHEQTSLADHVGGGPENADEPESPHGHAGMD